MFNLLSLLLLFFQAQQQPVQQPIPYSHKTHIALGLECKNCHKPPQTGDLMGFPATSVCMGCHQTVKKDSPAIQKLASYAADKKPVPWVRVYQVPGYVYFDHKSHLDKGATCQTCHGPVAQRDVIVKEVETSMGACMDCHHKNKAPNNCTFCHDTRN